MGQPGCSCLADTGGASHCLGVGCWEDTPGTCRSCATNADCPQGFACWRNDLGDQICLPVCAPLS
jgi:Cys-rich repeat protein